MSRLAITDLPLAGLKRVERRRLSDARGFLSRLFCADELRAAGWNVTPYPVDYRTGTRTPWTEYSLAKSAWRWQIALHEWAGLLAYRVAGRA